MQNSTIRSLYDMIIAKICQARTIRKPVMIRYPHFFGYMPKFLRGHRGDRW